MMLCREVSAYLQGNGPQPNDPETGQPLTKHPKAPTQRKKYGRCHCSQNKADPRSGKKCACDCKYNGVTYPVGQCPVCQCNCKLFIYLQNYLPMVIANSQPNAQSNQDIQAQATEYLNSQLSINRIQQEASANFYN